MNDLRLVVGVDACVLIEGIHLRNRLPANRPKRGVPLPHPSVRILRAAELQSFRLYIVDRALGEARRALAAYGKEAELDAFLTICQPYDTCPEITAATLGLTDAQYQTEG